MEDFLKYVVILTPSDVNMHIFVWYGGRYWAWLSKRLPSRVVGSEQVVFPEDSKCQDAEIFWQKNHLMFLSGVCDSLAWERRGSSVTTGFQVMLFFIKLKNFGGAAPHAWILIPQPGSEPTPLQWMLGFLATGPPEKTPDALIVSPVPSYPSLHQGFPSPKSSGVWQVDSCLLSLHCPQQVFQAITPSI